MGFDVLDMFAKKHGVRMRRKYCRALVGDARILGEEFMLAKPQTFMNSSGEAVREILVRQKLMPPFLMVVCDDVNLPLGKLRLRQRGSAGGHHGLTSIIESVHSSDFVRLRIGVGVGPNHRDVIDHVLGKFHKQEQALVDETLLRAVACLDSIIADGIEVAMHKFN